MILRYRRSVDQCFRVEIKEREGKVVYGKISLIFGFRQPDDAVVAVSPIAQVGGAECW